MKSKSFILVGIALTAIASAAILEPITLRRSLTPDANENYTMVTDVKQSVAVPGQGDMDFNFNTSMDVLMKTGAKDEKGMFGLETVMSNIKMTADGPMADQMMKQQESMPKEVKATGKMNDRNEMVMDAPKKGSGGAGAMMQMMMGSGSSSSIMFVTFPEKAVNVGDTWTFNLPKSPMYGKEAPVMNAKLVGEKDLNGKKVWVISTDGKIKIDTDLSEAMKDQPNNPAAGMSMVMKGVIDMTGEALVDQSNGRTLSYVTKAKSKSTMEVAGMSIDTSGTITNTIKAKS